MAKTRVVPASELSTKSLRASDYMKDEQDYPYYDVEIDMDPVGQDDGSYTEGTIHINRVTKDGTHEMVMWDSREWEEDPAVVFAIANAIRMCLLNPEEADNLYKSLGKIDG